MCSFKSVVGMMLICWGHVSRLQLSLQTSVLDSPDCGITRSMIMRPCLRLVPGKDTFNLAIKKKGKQAHQAARHSQRWNCVRRVCKTALIMSARHSRAAAVPLGETRDSCDLTKCYLLCSVSTRLVFFWLETQCLPRRFLTEYFFGVMPANLDHTNKAWNTEKKNKKDKRGRRKRWDKMEKIQKEGVKEEEEKTNQRKVQLKKRKRRREEDDLKCLNTPGGVKHKDLCSFWGKRPSIFHSSSPALRLASGCVWQAVC